MVLLTMILLFETGIVSNANSMTPRIFLILVCLVNLSGSDMVFPEEDAIFDCASDTTLIGWRVTSTCGSLDYKFTTSWTSWTLDYKF